MNYSFDFQSVTRNLGPLFDGLAVTLQLTVAANAIGLTLGFVLALLLMSPWRLMRLPVTLFVEFFRCTPALVQIIWFFYCVPMLFNVFLGSITMGILALGFNLAAFNAEAYRASIQAVPREQLDAGIALGLNPVQRILYIVLPTAFRASIPVLLTNGIVIFQQSALVAIVAVQDLMYQAKSLATQTYRPIETFSVAALIYFAVSFPVTQLVDYLERRRLAVAG
ncbi:amino acid ABC transporter permease [Mesorhizobium sp. VK25A]|uniref:Amino acid ABC transporter permease n=3 Tax=Mesorhizobium TaxID=68287 RepID=A0ABU5A884_9HYPH|nr:MULTISPECIES: amino acid ABC transporter permease [unclassified Mesorhizobium]MDX8443994.1 amino acid ABC transporter permease [Mesorhizobium sp. VK3C]MDX8469913.1 amino acid ABC transporter permease [Mesorhizobium sp. VK23B]MDX8476252.1 amino acid ABC transporter permease [Mesorhizobium sp. VK23A]MDX8509894.1 amino acid ABC transporter permease [Mesorhizobium sp. VK22E]MDX8528438.1 amino acid ABC transporter permease [Mesorhizobium sp. MSK_1335]